MKPKHILFLMGTYPSYGGVEIVSTTLANQFIKDGHQVTIASYKQPLHDAAPLNLSDQCDFSCYNIQSLTEKIQIIGEQIRLARLRGKLSTAQVVIWHNLFKKGI